QGDAVEQAALLDGLDERAVVVAGAGGRDDQPVAHFAGLAVGAANDLGVELDVQVGQDQADQLAAPKHQPAGEAVGPVTQLGDGGLHPGARVGVHDVAPVDHARDGADRDVRAPGDVGNGGGHFGSAPRGS